jgi:hypothetical protein
MKAAFPIDDFLIKAAQDKQLLPSHLALFMAIFYYSPYENPHEQFRVSRKSLMQFSKLQSKTTYHKCMQDLVLSGYILYEPSFDTYQASRITILKN